MKGRESGMPEKDVWEGFFNPAEVLHTMGLNAAVNDVAEFGCGYGTFTIPAAKIIKGQIYAIDIDSQMADMTKQAAEKEELKNVVTIVRDFVEKGTGLDGESVDYVMLFNILHIENPTALLQEANRILRQGGRLGIVHWNYDSRTPRGPSMDIRPKPQQCIEWASAVGFNNAEQFDLKPFHFGIILRKKKFI